MENSRRFLSNFPPFICPPANLVIRPGTPGQERATMTTRQQDKRERDEEFFRCHLRWHRTDRALSGLWQFFHGTFPVPVALPEESLLQYRE